MNNIVEQAYCGVERLVRPGLGFGSLRMARWTLADYEVMAMIKKGQVQNIGNRNMPALAAFIAKLFEATLNSRLTSPRAS